MFNLNPPMNRPYRRGGILFDFSPFEICKNHSQWNWQYSGKKSGFVFQKRRLLISWFLDFFLDSRIGVKHARYEILFCWVLDLISLSFLLELAYLFWCIFTQVYFYFTFETKIPNIVNVTWLSNTIIVLVIVIKI